MKKVVKWTLTVNIPLLLAGTLLSRGCDRNIDSIIEGNISPSEQIVQGFEQVGVGIKDGFYDLVDTVRELYQGRENE